MALRLLARLLEAEMKAVEAVLWVASKAEAQGNRLPLYVCAKGKVLDSLFGPEEADEPPRTTS